MKIYLCKKCNKTIPLEELAQHRQVCGPDSDITLKRGLGAKAGGFFGFMFRIVAAVVLTGVGIGLGTWSFHSIANMRQLERIPATVVEAVLPGEINLNGAAKKLDKQLTSPHWQKACFYYRYLKERQERDSDGDTHWVTVDQKTERVDFALSDKTGRIPVRATVGDIEFNLVKQQKQSGGYRYSEWRLEPNDEVFLFGYVVKGKKGYEVRFDKEGEYLPIVSKFGETKERIHMAWSSILKCWGGLACLAFAFGFIMRLLRVHHLLTYFSILSAIIFADLSIMGLKMMRSDLSGGLKCLERREKTVKGLVMGHLKDIQESWDGKWETLKDFNEYNGITDKGVRRLNRLRLDLAVATFRFQRQRNAFPERMFAPAWGIGNKPDLPVPSSQKKELDKLLAQFEEARLERGVGWGVIGGAFLVGILCFGFGFRRVRFKRCIENLPTSPTAGAVYGLCEFKGIVSLPDGEEPLQGPLSHMPCAQYRYIVKEKRGSGKNSKWVKIIDEKECAAFLIEDSEGSIWVDPSDAEVMTLHKSSRRRGRYHYIETRLELKDPIYAIGECVIEESQGDSLYLKKPTGSFPFILSNMTEDTVMRKLAAMGIGLLNVSFSAILLSALTLFGLGGSFAATDYLASAMAAPIFMIFVTLILHFNDLVFLRQRADRNWSNIDVSLQKRADLIPILEKTVKAYMAHESGILEAITKMRSDYGSGRADNHEHVAQFMESEHAALTEILGVFENYPNLKADEVANRLMRTLIVLENEVALMRKGFNDAVETYNTRVQTLPDMVFAKLFHFTSKEFLHAEAEIVRIPPSIQSLWEKDKAAKNREIQAAADEEDSAEQGSTTPAAPPAVPAAAAGAAATGSERAPEDMTAEAIDARAVIYALLLSEEESVRNAQLEAIKNDDSEEVRQKTAGLIDAVAGEIKDDVSRLQEAEQWLGKLEALAPSGYKAFKDLVRKLMEQDDEISLFEYALQKSMTRRLERVFGTHAIRRIRHPELGPVIEQVSLVISRIAYAEEKPSEMAQGVFDQAVSLLNYEPKSELTRVPVEQCSLAAFDAALDELAHTSRMIRTNLLYACTKAVEANEDYTYDQALLLAAIADTFELDRPDWIFSTQ